jgi:RES domain
VPSTQPPTTSRWSSNRTVLPAGSTLWRVHRRTRSAADFKPVVSDRHFGGGRFDSTPDDPYPFLYVALRQETALLETLVRGIPFDSRGLRYLRRAALSGLCISAVETTTELTLISLLSAADLAASCQDEWLVHADPSEYAKTRRWGHWLRTRSPWGQGLIWQSRRDLGEPTSMLFGDRAGPAPLLPVPGSAIDLDGVDGAAWLNNVLGPYRIQVKAPQTRGRSAG